MTAPLKSLFLLDPSVTYLNHGAYGATPRPVFERHVQWQYELEREPVDFLSRRFAERMAQARAILAEYVDTERDNLVYVSNGTTGVNIVARSLPLGPGDELLTTDHEHGGIERLWRFTAQKRGFEIVRHKVPLPVTTHARFIEDFWRDVTPRTRAILISQLTSPTALVFPVAAICARARARGILTIVDGSHVPGQLPLSLREMDPDFYVGILHKWVCAPKGSAFLYARPDVQPLVEPLVVSWGWEPKNPGPSKFVEYHEWQGSRDISAFLSVPSAIAFQREHDWDGVRKRCIALASDAQREVAALTREPLYHPPGAHEWHGQMVCAQLPPQTDDIALLARLRNECGIDVSVDRFGGRPRIRVSIQGYNGPDDVDRLLGSLKQLLRL
ncbi:cys/Met metabolism PLP-dependent enzyme family protein [Burkholderia pseudomallei]|uniref:aminotransferase class V-fold PLP-dependent enzyme n=1 Tax=Burkholderia pseudomallei TaxID=28450 RepID=UPI0000F28D33|nr:aminotransferase class V-fold PLP-dependent enzyme [Burkholderia pseudomallei]ABN86746.1 selenocysteine lyase [Burkholderia pseudomallei 668]AJX90283.1 cys/Met metabolism PLP-dependent enzyme family protein [Burkholderia pseudomallei]